MGTESPEVRVQATPEAGGLGGGSNPLRLKQGGREGGGLELLARKESTTQGFPGGPAVLRGISGLSEHLVVNW